MKNLISPANQFRHVYSLQTILLIVSFLEHSRGLEPAYRGTVFRFYPSVSQP